MADLQNEPPPASASTPPSNVPVSATLLVYILFGLAAVIALVGQGMMVGAPLLTLIGIVAVIIAYVKRDDARGTWTESHMTWLIRTFWWSLLWNALGWIVAVTLIGIPLAIAIWVVTTIWVIYRLIRGYLYFKDSQPIPA
ncbi:MAG TPA: hypothetical protein VLI21_14565 [Casimicrobiaceae bacterium]|nr:hypothetical protein [Casimicrobiaceae bacterium]